MIYRAYAGGKEINDFYTGGKETKEIWGGDTLLWRKGEENFSGFRVRVRTKVNSYGRAFFEFGATEGTFTVQIEGEEKIIYENCKENYYLQIPSTANYSPNIYIDRTITFKGDLKKLNALHGDNGRILQILDPFPVGLKAANAKTFFYEQRLLEYICPKVFKNIAEEMNKETYYANYFLYTESLKNIPADLFAGLSITGNIDNMFQYSGIEEIPEGLLAGFNPKGTIGVFENCKNLKKIPEHLFSSFLQCEQFRYTFSGCESLEYIPEHIFENCSNVQSFENVFRGCKALTHIPQKLFINNTMASDFVNAFCDCESLLSIPGKLFSYSNAPRIKVAHIWNGCKNITEVPEDIFYVKTKITYLWGVFANCTSLETVPENAIPINGVENGFVQVFYGCINLKSAPKIWLKVAPPDYDWVDKLYAEKCYKDCTSLPYYTEIPDTWK